MEEAELGTLPAQGLVVSGQGGGQLLPDAACGASGVPRTIGSSCGNSGGGNSPKLGVRAFRWARARGPLKVTSQPDWARSQLSTSDCSHLEVSVGRDCVQAGAKGKQGLGDSREGLGDKREGLGTAKKAWGQ